MTDGSCAPKVCHPELVEGSWHRSKREHPAFVQPLCQDALSSEETRSTPQPRKARRLCIRSFLLPLQIKTFALIWRRGYGDGIMPAEWSPVRRRASLSMTSLDNSSFLIISDFICICAFQSKKQHPISQVLSFHCNQIPLVGIAPLGQM